MSLRLHPGVSSVARCFGDQECLRGGMVITTPSIFESPNHKIKRRLKQDKKVKYDAREQKEVKPTTKKNNTTVKPVKTQPKTREPRLPGT
jgi:hypothetical protein